MITRSRTTASTALVLLLAGAAAPAHAQQSFALVMEGALDVRSAIVENGTTTPLAGPSVFTLEALFDASSPNLVVPVGVPGFVAYTPTSVLLTLGGRTYTMQGYDAAHPLGVAVAIFDATTPFGPPSGGRYGVGLVQNPLADGAGFISDFMGATPAFTIGAGGLVSTTFTQYAGTGFTSGVCTNGTGGRCLEYASTPIPLTWAGQSFALQLGSYDDEAASGTTFTASVVALAAPEPDARVLLAAGLLGAAAAARWGRSRRRLTDA